MCTAGGGGGGAGWRDWAEGEGVCETEMKKWKKEEEEERSFFFYRKTRERESSELYYTTIKILGSCLILQSVPANLHANRLHIKQ